MAKFERFLFPEVFERQKPLIGQNPYRYSHVDLDGARELALLMKETDTILDGYSEGQPFAGRVFAAHSECDTTASIAGIEKLQSAVVPDRFTFFRIPRSAAVSHASVVLAQPIPETGEVLEKANPLFAEMMAAMATFASAPVAGETAAG